ncbi:NUDIX hydrolase [Polaribacter ponticola]|uniref:NUDIX domain-containing protein n=1 Tax=Polaribacter ponticola TaxID=2978475 RepID=A0ABT5S4T9_9FLAO|nr:NUDIX domain-containing protein [Polaribacter sp. MSW5]MDD7913116.1 NUDIX domain-containing protein [Polaribacter sp. MSW5]
MDEFIDILTSKGEFTGETALKSEAHKHGWFHQTVHVWFYTVTKKILLQKRASVKKVFPNHWDVSVAGHISAGERVEKAAIREVKEEIGIDIEESDLQKIGFRKDEIVHPNGILDNEFKHIYVCKLNKSINQLIMQPEEIDDLQLFDLSILKDTTKHGSFMVPNMNRYYDFIYEKIYSLGL